MHRKIIIIILFTPPRISLNQICRWREQTKKKKRSEAREDDRLRRRCWSPGELSSLPIAISASVFRNLTPQSVLIDLYTPKYDFYRINLENWIRAEQSTLHTELHRCRWRPEAPSHRPLLPRRCWWARYHSLDPFGIWVLVSALYMKWDFEMAGFDFVNGCLNWVNGNEC